jgi:CheY-like chemotaxis protein
MVEPSSALHDFAVLAQPDARLELLAPIVSELKERWPSPAPVVELFGEPQTGEMVVLLRFSIAHLSAALRMKLDREAGRLQGRLVEPSLLSVTDRDLFWEKLNGLPVRQTASDDPEAAVQAFCAGMGLVGMALLPVDFDSPEALALAWARCAAEGSLLVPCGRRPPTGTNVAMTLRVADQEPLAATGRVLDKLPDDPADRVRVSIDPNEELLRFAARQQALQRRGLRRMPEGGRRVHPRFASCLEVSFDTSEGLREAYATDIGKGGLFVRTEDPPPMRANIRLRLELPDQTVVETDAEVVHVVTVEQARANRIPPGAGVAFNVSDSLFLKAIDGFLAATPARKPRVLLVDDDRFFRVVLSDALVQAGFEVDSVGDGKQALEKIASRLWEIDVLIADLLLPGLDGWCLIDRVRQLGPENDLKVVVLSAAVSDLHLSQLQGPGGADDVIAKGTPLEEIVASILKVIGRG